MQGLRTLLAAAVPLASGYQGEPSERLSGDKGQRLSAASADSPPTHEEAVPDDPPRCLAMMPPHTDRLRRVHTPPRPSANPDGAITLIS